MFAWRCCKAKYAEDAFRGFGSEEHPGRWNLRGTRVVYASDSAALSVLEALLGLQDLASLARHFVLIRVEVPDDQVTYLTEDELPPSWGAHPHGTATQRIGTDWLRSQETPALVVPSALVTGHNVLLNPQHPALEDLLNSASEPRSLPFKGPFPDGS